MLINRIELKNFRNHREAVFDFERGINLILGENGSGKTSILDAIGFTLFNMKLRSDASDTLSVNESSGHVKVLFTGNDGNLYTITRKIPTGAVSLSVEGVMKNITGVTEVYRAVNSVIGNDMENVSLFENVIVASQNKFTSIFDSRPAEREAVFNSIFGTEIYRDMYNGILKKSCDQYDKNISFEEGDIGAKIAQVKDSKILEKMRLEAEKNFSDARTRYVEIEKEIEKTEKSLNELSEIKTRKDKLVLTLDSINLQLTEKKKIITRLADELKSAESASHEVVRLKSAHEKYSIVKKDQDKILLEVNSLEKAEREFNANKDKIASLEKSIVVSTGDKKRFEQLIESDTFTAGSLRREIEKFSKAIELLEKEKSFCEGEIKTLAERKNAFNILYNKFKEAMDLASKRATLALQGEESVIDESLLLEEIAVLENKTTALMGMKTERDQLNVEITKYNTLLSELDEAQKELSKQTCPYLKEQCKNIENAGSISGYFDPKKKDIIIKLDGFKKQLSAYENIDDSIKKCANDKSIKTEQVVRNRKNIQDAMKYRTEESGFKQSAAEYALAISKLFSGLTGSDSICISKDDYDGAYAGMQRADAGFNTTIAMTTASLNEKQNELKKKELELSDILKNLELTGKRISIINNQIEKYNLELKKNIDSAVILEQKIFPLADLKKESAGLVMKLKELEPLDQEYRLAFQKASVRDDLNSRLDSENKEFEKLSLKLKETEVENNSIYYNADEYGKLFLSCSDLKMKLKDQNAIFGNLQSVYTMAVKDEENNNKLKCEIEEKLLLINTLKHKRDVAGKFREDIKLLGPYISGRRTKMIAAAATENFQRMTGRSERILWENTPEQYLVSIASSSGKRRFNMLSGGEQVAVALSIRSALASEMTDCRFAIFDEPTINLDAEKREALSVSLHDMLKNLEQALIVTHDTSFREMATNVIELK